MYEMIFKRKSFHVFRNIQSISDLELKELNEFVEQIKPLDNTIQYTIRMIQESKRGSEYCIEFYSEEKGNYLRNIGYIGEQIDLYLVSKNIGTLWFGIGKPERKEIDGLSFVIMMAIAKVDASSFRKDMFKAKRKALDEIWIGEPLPLSDIVRFAPSACNSQPWIVENENNVLSVYRYKKAGKRGIMPMNKVSFYNRIDIGIFLYLLEVCLEHDGYVFTNQQFYEDAEEDERIMVSKYELYTSE